MKNWIRVAVAAALIVTGSTKDAMAAAPKIIYTDALQNGWQPWGWATINYNNGAPVHSGGKSIAVTVKKGFDALYIHHDAFSTAGLHALTFWVNGGARGGQVLQIQATVNKKPVKYFKLAALPAHSWTKISVPLGALGIANRPNVDGFWIQDGSGKPLPTFYVDDIALK